RTPSSSGGSGCRWCGSSSGSRSSPPSGDVRSVATRRSGTDAQMTTLRVALLHLRIGILNDLQYRVNFALQVLQSLLALATGLVVLALVYSHVAELNGWSQPELLAVLGTQILIGGVIRAVIQPN